MMKTILGMILAVSFFGDIFFKVIKTTIIIIILCNLQPFAGLARCWKLLQFFFQVLFNIILKDASKYNYYLAFV